MREAIRIVLGIPGFELRKPSPLHRGHVSSVESTWPVPLHITHILLAATRCLLV